MYQCPKCGEAEQYAEMWHKLGRERFCLVCGETTVAVRAMKPKKVEAGKGRPHFTKKERRRIKEYVKVNHPQDEYANMLVDSM